VPLADKIGEEGRGEGEKKKIPSFLSQEYTLSPFPFRLQLHGKP